MIEAIGQPTTPRSWPTEEESGFQMKILARKLIDSGELRTIDDAVSRFKTRTAWYLGMQGIISKKTAEVCIRMETQFLRSAKKYFNELKEMKDAFK